MWVSPYDIFVTQGMLPVLTQLSWGPSGFQIGCPFVRIPSSTFSIHPCCIYECPEWIWSIRAIDSLFLSSIASWKVPHSTGWAVQSVISFCKSSLSYSGASAWQVHQGALGSFG
jgi:hypothetical protein